jgi:hypothetical protein
VKTGVQAVLKAPKILVFGLRRNDGKKTQPGFFAPPGRARVGGQRAPKVKSSNHRKNPYGPLNARLKTIFRKNLYI